MERSFARGGFSVLLLFTYLAILIMSLGLFFGFDGDGVQRLLWTSIGAFFAHILLVLEQGVHDGAEIQREQLALQKEQLAQAKALAASTAYIEKRLAVLCDAFASDHSRPME